jgi:hypothetical protein
MSPPNDELPTTSKWVPNNKLIGGAVIGQAAAQIIVAICDRFLHAPLGPELSSAITTLCYAAAAYFIPNRQQQ